MSGYGADEISSRGLSTGKSAIVEKPFQADLLLRRVREVLDHAPARDSAQRGHVGWTGARNTPR